MTKHNDQLLPCPFCGDPNPNLTQDDYVHDDLRPMPVVECTKCHTWVRAGAWNNRAQLPAGGAVPYTLTEQAPFVIRDAQGRYVAELLAWDAELIGAMLAVAPHPVSDWARKALSADNQRVKPVEPMLAPRHPFDKPSLLKDCNVSYSNSSAHPVSGEQGELDEYRFAHIEIDGLLMGAVDFDITHEGNYKAALLNTLGALRKLIGNQTAAQDVSGLCDLVYDVCEWFELRGLHELNIYKALKAAHRAQAQGGDS